MTEIIKFDTKEEESLYFIYKAVEKLGYLNNYKYIKNDGTIIWKDENNIPSNEELQQAIDEIETEYNKQLFIDDLTEVCDYMQDKCFSQIANNKVNDKQYIRYKNKKKTALKAKSGDAKAKELLQPEAQLNNISVDTLIEYILQKADIYEEMEEEYSAKIEYFRIKAMSNIDYLALEKFKKLDVPFDYSDIDNCFGG